MTWTLLTVCWEDSKKGKTKIRLHSERVITGLGGTSEERLKPLTHNCSIKNGETVCPGRATGLDSLRSCPTHKPSWGWYRDPAKPHSILRVAVSSSPVTSEGKGLLVRLRVDLTQALGRQEWLALCRGRRGRGTGWGSTWKVRVLLSREGLCGPEPSHVSWGGGLGALRVPSQSTSLKPARGVSTTSWTRGLPY